MSARFLIFLVVIFCYGCEREHGKTQAELVYQGIERKNIGSYVITYSSDMDLLNIFSRAKAEGQLATMLKCSLEGDTVFTAEHVIKKKFEGVIGISGETPGPPFIFRTSGTLSVTHNGGTSSARLSNEELEDSLRQREEVMCKAFITVFGYKAYYSKPMFIPSADILREVRRDLRN